MAVLRCIHELPKKAVEKLNALINRYNVTPHDRTSDRRSGLEKIVEYINANPTLNTEKLTGWRKEKDGLTDTLNRYNVKEKINIRPAHMHYKETLHKLHDSSDDKNNSHSVKP